MARRIRLQTPSSTYHAMLRGNNRENIHSDYDGHAYAYFYNNRLSSLTKLANRIEIKIPNNPTIAYRQQKALEWINKMSECQSLDKSLLRFSGHFEIKKCRMIA